MASAHFRGRLRRKLMNPGSKSEVVGFVLETPGGEALAVEHRRDAPFRFESLEPFEDRLVEARGELYRGRLLVDDIHSAE